MSVLIFVIAVAAAGVLMGLRFKVAALIAATALLVVGSLAWKGLGLPGQVTLTNLVIQMFVLAGTYLIGLSLSANRRG